jgi:hypothetical protein
MAIRERESGGVQKNSLVDQARRAQLGVEAQTEDLLEATLVVVEEVLGGIVDGANIDDDIAPAQDGRVARTDNI